MNVLFLIPHPFYEDRGSPIADSMVLQVLSERGERVDAVTYPEGQDRDYDRISIHRTWRVPFIRNVRPGFSWKKLVYDALMVAAIVPLLLKRRYHLIHAVEETAFIALALKWLFKVPYVYDMDSSLAQQMVEKYPALGPLGRVFRWFEGQAVKHAKVVVPVCDALAKDIAPYRPQRVVLLPDISLLKDDKTLAQQEDLRSRFGITGTLLMYVGNLESYQGIDLLLDGMALALKKNENIDLVVVGGQEADIQTYRRKARDLGIGGRVFFLGQKPANELGSYLRQADVLVSPRIKGRNTPMKIYSYLDSGKAVLATDLSTHTQVLTDRVSLLTDPTPESFGAGIAKLAGDRALRERLGEAGRQLVQEKYSYGAFRKKLFRLYDWLRSEVMDLPDAPGAEPEELFAS